MAFISQRKICPFCEYPEMVINYKEYKVLRKFLTEQGKIIPGFVTGVCSKHQRQLTRAIKQSRNIALLPFSTDYRDI
ncbi:MAG: 30S ribosomal protein S18 [Fidelibacterota bacterium]